VRKRQERCAPFAALLIALAAAGCVDPAWDLEALEGRHPALRSVAGHRLRDVTPYLLPVSGTLTLFLCRWPDAARVSVSLPPDATPEERRALEAALAAWQGAGLGLRFETSAGRAAEIEIRFEEGLLSYSANTVAHCAVDPVALAEPKRAGALPARLVFASIHLGHGDPRLAGTALHELGHALGFQGHPRRGESVMLRSTERQRLTGQRVLAGEPFSDAALRGLYAVPSGTVLGRLPLAAGQSAVVDRLARLAAQRGLTGPVVEVGERAGRIGWSDAGRPTVALLLRNLRQALQDPSKLSIEANRAATRMLAGER
jgi:hypothetical protein